MVSGTIRYKVIPVLVVVICSIVPLFFFHKEKQSDLVYSATASDLDLAVVDGIVKVDKNSKYITSDTTKAVIVPHHLVATEAIAAGIKSIATKKERIVLLISPDHFGGCPTLVCTTAGAYKTFFGNVDINSTIVKQLIGNKEIVSTSNLFTNEHGVYSIVPYIKHYLPEATIVPIVISQKGRGTDQSRKEMLAMIDTLIMRDDVLLVVSSDFSHYLPIKEADTYDKETRSSFCSGNGNKVLTLNNPSQSDCPLCLWVLQEEAKKNNFWTPHMLWHSNSAELLHDLSVKETTSHFTFTFDTSTSTLHQIDMQSSCNLSKEEKSSSQKVTILFVGDMSFDRYIRQVSKKKGDDFVFSCIGDFLKEYDFVVGNLEGPITDNPSSSVGTKMGTPKNYVFTFPPTTAKLLKKHNIGVVNIGNNHISNYGEEGITSTKKYLNTAGVNFFGGLHGDEPIYDTDTNISFVSYNQFGGNSPQKVAEIIADEKSKGKMVLVYAHWGLEYSSDVSGIRTIAKLFSESGADVIIGSHPHVVLPSEYIGNTLVYYSLGNFIFDQYFDNNVRQGLTVALTIVNNTIEVKEYPVKLETDGRTCLTH